MQDETIWDRDARAFMIPCITRYGNENTEAKVAFQAARYADALAAQRAKRKAAASTEVKNLSTGEIRCSDS